MWQSITGMIHEVKRVEAAGATTATVIMVYVCIDALAALALPRGREVQGKADFIAWVDQYLKAHPDQPYQYRGVDVYGARCALLHSFASEAEFHRRNEGIKQFGYTNGGLHMYNPAASPDLVLIGVASLTNDFVIAVETFLKDIAADADLRATIEARLPSILLLHPISEGSILETGPR